MTKGLSLRITNSVLVAIAAIVFIAGPQLASAQRLNDDGSSSKANGARSVKAPKAAPAAPSVPLVDQTWLNTAGNTDFNAGTSWVSGTAPGAGDRAIFAAAAVAQPDLSASISIGNLQFSAVGSSGYDLTSSAGATLTLTSVNVTAGSGLRAIDASNTSGTNIIDAPIILGGAAASTQVFSQARGGTLVINGVISSTNAITGLRLDSAGSGISTFTLSNANTYAGNTLVNGAVASTVLNINNATAISSGALVATAGFMMDNTSGSAITLTNNNNINLSGGSLTFIGTNNLNFGSNTVTLSVANRTITTNGGVLSVGSIAQDAMPRNLTKAGAGTLVVTGTGSYTGTTSITGGILQLGNGGSTGSLSTSSAISVSTGARFKINQGDAVVQGTDFSGAAITGAGSFEHAGFGTVTLNAANTYSGGTIVSGIGPVTSAPAGGPPELIATIDGALGGGNVSLTASGVRLTLQGGATNNYISDNATLSMVTGSTANLNFSGTDTISGLILGGVVQTNPGTYGSSDSGAQFQFNDFFLSGGTLTLIPEPSTWAMTVMGVGLLLGVQRFRRRKS